MKLTVEEMSSLTAYVMSGATVEQFIKDFEIPEDQQDEAREYWDSMKYRFDNMEPDQQMMVPNEWS